MSAEVTLLNGRYRLLRELGRGGMAVIWETHDAVLDRRVAVKLLHPQFAGDPEFLERFRREARAAASLAHPNVVGVYDVGQDTATGNPFLVMELVEGESLKDHIRRADPCIRARCARCSRIDARGAPAAEPPGPAAERGGRGLPGGAPGPGRRAGGPGRRILRAGHLQPPQRGATARADERANTLALRNRPGRRAAFRGAHSFANASP